MNGQPGDASPARPCSAGPLVVILVWALGVSSAEAASIRLTQDPNAGTFQMGNHETRQTHFKALNNVTLTELGVDVDPPSSSANQWRVFNSDVSGTFGSAIFTSDVFSLVDVGQAVYDFPVSISLDAGSFYILEFEAFPILFLMRHFDEGQQALPLTSSDGNFQVLNGGGNRNFTNGILPAFSVTTATVIPEPVSAVLFAVGALVVGAGVSRSRRHA